MDAKPQRPVRALRMHDENAPPVSNTGPGKTIHHRNKSTPALSTLMQTGAIRAGVKRSAFADVSNNTKVQPAKDDYSVAAVVCETKAQLASMQELVNKPTALSKPAQRPLAVKSSNQQLNAVATAIPTKPAASMVSQAQVPSVVPRKLVAKKSAPVLRDAPQISCVDLPSLDYAEVVDSAVENPQPSFESIVKPAAPVSHGIILPGLDIITEEAVAAPGPVQPIERQNSAAERLAFAGVAEKLQTLGSDKNFTLSSHTQTVPTYDQDYESEDELEFIPDDYTNATTGGATTIVLAPKYTKRVEQELEDAKLVVESSRTVEDVEDEQWDTSMVAEYGDEIFSYMRELEEKMRPDPHYMDIQQDCQWSMRAILMDWLVQVHHRFGLLPETLFLAVNYIDRFLSCKVVSVNKLQLVGATAIFLAAKYEEVNCPSIAEIVYMVDNGYTTEEILKAERYMLSMLRFQLGWPGPMSFLRRISKADDYDLETRTLAKYFLELTIMDERFVGCAPSFLAAGAHCLARLMLRKGEWTMGHVHYSNYTYSQIRYLLATMVECCEEPEKHHAAVFSKYTDRRFKRASLFVQTEMSKGFKLPVYKRESSTAYPDDTRGW